MSLNADRDGVVEIESVHVWTSRRRRNLLHQFNRETLSFRCNSGQRLLEPLAEYRGICAVVSKRAHIFEGHCAMAKDVWWLRERGQIKGPFRRDDLKAMKSSGQLNRFHKVSPDKKTWYSATEVDLDSSAAPGQSPTSPPPLDVPPWESPDETVSSPATASVVPPPVQQAPPMTLTEPVVIPFPIFILLFMHFATLGLFTFIWVTRLHGKLPRLADEDMTTGQAFKLALIPFLNLFWGNFAVYQELCRRINGIRAAMNLQGRISVWFAAIIAGAIAASVTLCIVWMFVTVVSGVGAPQTEAVQRPQTQSLTDLMQTNPMELVRGDPMAMWIFLIPGVSLGLLSVFILIPIFAAFVQSSCNQIGLAQIRLLQSRRTS